MRVHSHTYVCVGVVRMHEHRISLPLPPSLMENGGRMEREREQGRSYHPLDTHTYTRTRTHLAAALEINHVLRLLRPRFRDVDRLQLNVLGERQVLEGYFDELSSVDRVAPEVVPFLRLRGHRISVFVFCLHACIDNEWISIPWRKRCVRPMHHPFHHAALPSPGTRRRQRRTGE